MSDKTFNFPVLIIGEAVTDTSSVCGNEFSMTAKVLGHRDGDFSFRMVVPNNGAPDYLIVRGQLVQRVAIDISNPRWPVYTYASITMHAVEVPAEGTAFSFPVGGFQ